MQLQDQLDQMESTQAKIEETQVLKTIIEKKVAMI